MMAMRLDHLSDSQLTFVHEEAQKDLAELSIWLNKTENAVCRAQQDARHLVYRIQQYAAEIQERAARKTC